MSNPTVAVAFGGGGARGVAHVHVMLALDDLGITPVAIAGSSIGAIMGAAYGAGMSGDDIRAYVLHTFDNKSRVLSQLWSLRPGSMREFLTGSPFRIGEMNAERVLRGFLPPHLPEDFRDLAVPLTVMATDYYGQRELAIREGALFPALAASAAVPAVFKPVKRRGAVLIDGGISNPVPFDQLYEKADILLAVDVVGGPDGAPGATPSRIDALFGASQLMMQSITSMKRKIRPPDIMIRPNVSAYRALEFLKSAEILRASRHTRDEVKRALEAALSFAD